MGTKNEPGQFDCYRKADFDEPMFTLLARDPLAPDLVRTWAEHYEDAHSDAPLDKRMKVNEKASEARMCATNMEAWAAKNQLSSLRDERNELRYLVAGLMHKSLTEDQVRNHHAFKGVKDAFLKGDLATETKQFRDENRALREEVEPNDEH